MKHLMPQVQDFKLLGNYKLSIRFTDNHQQTLDLSLMLRGELYGPLKSEAMFNQVRIDPEIKTLVWPNGADFDPEVLYNWDKCKDELLARAKKWEDE